MANSVINQRNGPIWPLGCVVVPSPGTPVLLSFNIDPNNINNPGNVSPGNYGGMETSPAFAGIGIQGYHQLGGNNNAAMIPNNANVYLLVAKGNGSGNASDSGCMVKVIPPGADVFIPASYFVGMFSPYSLYLDADNANDAGLVVGYGGGNI